MIDPDVVEVRDVERIVACPGIRVDDAIRQNHAAYDRHYGFCAGVGDHLGVDLPSMFEDAEDRNLAGGATATFFLSLAAKVTFIGLNFAIQGRGSSNFSLNDNALAS